MKHARVDGLVRLKVERNLLLFAFIRQNRTDKEHETVGRDTIVKLEALLCGRDSGQNRKTIDSRLDVGRSTIFLRQHG